MIFITLCLGVCKGVNGCLINICGCSPISNLQHLRKFQNGSRSWWFYSETKILPKQTKHWKSKDGKEQYCSIKKGIPRTFLKVKEGPGKNEARGKAGAAFEFVFMFLTSVERLLGNNQGTLPSRYLIKERAINIMNCHQVAFPVSRSYWMSISRKH